MKYIWYSPQKSKHPLYIDSWINHIRHFIHIQFADKKIEFINLPNLFKSVILSIPTYFEK